MTKTYVFQSLKSGLSIPDPTDPLPADRHEAKHYVRRMVRFMNNVFTTTDEALAKALVEDREKAMAAGRIPGYVPIDAVPEKETKINIHQGALSVDNAGPKKGKKGKAQAAPAEGVESGGYKPSAE